MQLVQRKHLIRSLEIPCSLACVWTCTVALLCFFAFSSNVLARAGNGTESGRSGHDRPSFPSALPHKTSEGEVSDSHCNPLCTFSRVNRAPKQTPAHTKRGAGHVQWMMSFQLKHGIWVTRTNQVWLSHRVLAVTPVITGWPAESLGSVCRGCTYMVKA